MVSVTKYKQILGYQELTNHLFSWYLTAVNSDIVDSYGQTVLTVKCIK